MIAPSAESTTLPESGNILPGFDFASATAPTARPAPVPIGGRNEGAPPPEIDRGIAEIVRELDPDRYYQSSSTAGNGVVSGVSYNWREPRLFYGSYPVFNTEIGSASIPTLEAIQAWMPQKDLFDFNFPNDDWAGHFLVSGNGNPVDKPFQAVIAKRYGPYNTLADFVRKAQLALGARQE
jgi:beta-mannosidase